MSRYEHRIYGQSEATVIDERTGLPRPATAEELERLDEAYRRQLEASMRQVPE